MSGQNAMNKDHKLPGNVRRYRGVSGEERKEERRHRLIGAGLAMFGLSGYHGATVKAICVQAGLSERYFYESFANSEDLLCAVYEQHMALQRERILDAVMRSPRDPGSMIAAGLRAFLELARENPAAARVQFVEVLGVSPRVDKLYRRAIESFAEQLRQLNVQLSHSEVRPARDEETLSIGLVGATVGIASRWLLTDFAQPLESVLGTTLIIFRGVWQQRTDDQLQRGTDM